MRKLVCLLHVSLDGFIAGVNGEMDWIVVNDDLFDKVGEIVDQADIAVYGRVTFQMMEAYWPTAADKPNASKHDIEHGNWSNKALKLVASHSMSQTSWQNTQFINIDFPEAITHYKQQEGKNLLLIGSASLVHLLAPLGLIDEYWISLNPVILGRGIPLFKNVREIIHLELESAQTLKSGVVFLHYINRHG